MAGGLRAVSSGQLKAAGGMHSIIAVRSIQTIMRRLEQLTARPPVSAAGQPGENQLHPVGTAKAAAVSVVNSFTGAVSVQNPYFPNCSRSLRVSRCALG